ncbi:MAG: glycosyltransferase family 4 protein [Bacteroidales bacterium]|nr:glycosyltransferase family 4 protein [Bacteroidales bacterium]
MWKRAIKFEMGKSMQNEKQTTVMLIHYYFPPRGGAAVQRIVKFCKYLQQFNCRVIVMTSGVDYDIQDLDLLESIPPDTKVFTTYPPGQTKAMEGQFGRRNMIIDAFLAWVPSALKKAREIIAEYDIDVLLTTSPPHSQHIIGMRLKKETGLPWVADFRDPWTSDLRFMRYKKGWRSIIDRYVEKRILKRADIVIATTKSATESFRQKAPASCDQTKFKCIVNGYDPDDYNQIKHSSNSEVMTFAYVGSAGPLISDPSFFFRGLKIAIDRESDLREKVRVQFIGGLDPQNRALIRELGLKDVIVFLGFFPHQKAIQSIVDSDVLLLFELPVGTNNEPTRVIPSKVFEYIGANRPIMAMVVEGDTADLLKGYKLARVIEPNNLNDISDAVIDYFRQFQEGTLGRVTFSPPAEFSRKEQVRHLSEILHGLHR